MAPLNWLPQRNAPDKFVRVPSSVGIAPWGINYISSTGDEQRFDKNTYHYSMFVGFLGDKLRLTYGKRLDSERFAGAGGSEYWYLGVTDVPGLVYWLMRSL